MGVKQVFTHRSIDSDVARHCWDELKHTVSKEKAFQATEIIGELAANDMLEFSGKSREEIDRIYVKLRDGMPMASGMRKALPYVDVRYIVSKEKQQDDINHVPISFYDGYDGYSNETVWFADPINATGHTAVESLRYVRAHFEFQTALVSHVAANVSGIRNLQTAIDDFSARGFMNYAYLSKKLDGKGYLADGLELIPDFGDKIFGTLGSDFSIYDIQEGIMRLAGTGVGDVETLKGTILHIIQLAGKEEYAADRTASWITRNWINAALQWCWAVGEVHFKKSNEEQVFTLIEDLHSCGFLKTEPRPWKNDIAYVYSLTEDGFKYASRVYIPVLATYDISRGIQKHFDFLIHLRPAEILQNVKDETWEK
jgi:uracil phosphoribosyltransferase